MFVVDLNMEMPICCDDCKFANGHHCLISGEWMANMSGIYKNGERVRDSTCPIKAEIKAENEDEKLRSTLSVLRYKNIITEDEYQSFISELDSKDGHIKQLQNFVYQTEKTICALRDERARFENELKKILKMN